jgi:hypothetical protein
MSKGNEVPVVRKLAIIAAILALPGCFESQQDFEVEIALDSSIATVVEISWTTEEPGVSWVEFGREGSYDMITPLQSEASTEHRFRLVGVAAETELSFRAVTETATATLISEGSTETGALPEGLPRFRVDQHDESLCLSSRWLVTGYEGEESSWLVAVDRRGGIVWYERVYEDGTPFSIEPAQDGPGVLYNARQRREEGVDSHLVATGLLDDPDAQTAMTRGHHAMTQLPLGGVAWIGADLREWYNPEADETMVVQGDTVNVLTPTGESLQVFNAWDWGQPRFSQWFDNEYFAGAKDWTHANALSVHPERGTMLVSLRNLGVLLDIDMGRKEVLRVLGADRPGAFTEGSTRFSYQHDPNWTPDGTILMISSEEQDNGRTETAAREYRIVEDDALEEIWSYGVGMGIHASHHGGARVLENGNRLVNFGAAGVVHEATPEGETAWAISSVPEVSLGGSFLVDDLYELVR